MKGTIVVIVAIAGLAVLAVDRDHQEPPGLDEAAAVHAYLCGYVAGERKAALVLHVDVGPEPEECVAARQLAESAGLKP